MNEKDPESAALEDKKSQGETPPEIVIVNEYHSGKVRPKDDN